MYIKFCRGYGGNKKDEALANLSPGSKLSVELEGEKGNQTEGNTRLYRAVCLFLTIMCLLLLVVVIVLSMKLQQGSTACMGREGEPGQARQTPLDPVCSLQQCQALLPRTDQPQHRHCMQCADGWLTLGQSCFYLSTARLSWEESQKNCTANGGSLAIISSAMVQQFLSVKGKFQYWIGLKNNGQAWTWVNNTVLTQSYWADNPLKGDCGLLASADASEKNWKKASCEASTYFICELHM